MADEIIVCSNITPPTADGSPRPFDPKWRTETVLALAKAIEAEAAFDRLPILADALEAAGCREPLVLRHLRECGQHRSGCWALRLILTPPKSQDTKPPVQIDWADDDKSVRVYSKDSTDLRQNEASNVMWRTLTIFAFIFIAILIIRAVALFALGR